MLKFLKTLLLVLLFNPIFSQHGSSKYVVVLQDRKGIFLYNTKTLDKKQIYKATEFEVFLDEPIEIKNDSQFVFGVNGDLSFFSDVNNKPYGEMFIKKYFILNVKNSKNELYKEVKYIVRGYDSLYVISTFFEKEVKKSEEIERFKYTGAKSTAKSRIYYTRDSKTFFKNELFSNEVKGKKVAAFLGDLLLYTAKDTSLIAHSDELYNSQLENGFSNPQLTPNGNEIYCTFQTSDGNGKTLNSLLKIEIDSKKQNKLLEGEFSNLKISTTGNALLFLRNQKNTSLRTWQSDVFILDTQSLKITKIAKGYDAFWF